MCQFTQCSAHDDLKNPHCAGSATHIVRNDLQELNQILEELNKIKLDQSQRIAALTRKLNEMSACCEPRLKVDRTPGISAVCKIFDKFVIHT